MSILTKYILSMFNTHTNNLIIMCTLFNNTKLFVYGHFYQLQYFLYFLVVSIVSFQQRRRT